jgi:hypothetical protein
MLTQYPPASPALCCKSFSPKRLLYDLALCQRYYCGLIGMFSICIITLTCYLLKITHRDFPSFCNYLSTFMYNLESTWFCISGFHCCGQQLGKYQTKSRKVCLDSQFQPMAAWLCCCLRQIIMYPCDRTKYLGQLIESGNKTQESGRDPEHDTSNDSLHQRLLPSSSSKL